MTIIAFNRYWVVRWPWMLVNVLVLALLLGLSFWQWQRAAEKNKTLARIANWQQQGPVDIARLSIINATARDGVQVNFVGRWLAPMVWLVDNKMVNGRIGYDVLIAVEDLSSPQHSAALLVNFGWVAAPLQRDLLPAVDVPAELRIEGIFRTRTKGFLLGTNIENNGVWPMRIQQVDAVSLSAFLNQPLISGVVYQEKNSPFLIHYRPVILPPERHKAYALQWLLLAVAVVVIALLASARKHPPGVEL
ncbi:SURF1 family protein [Cellvibrio sp. OA-2007]|uniref:SURF1 family protein n=1 Tax=Cellvibrio sp. OA-2007 TaxID=529823 RepID=UPI000785CFB1|nr:SURF1 family protein [Cellvibrio sp. OA-2007]